MDDPSAAMAAGLQGGGDAGWFAGLGLNDEGGECFFPALADLFQAASAAASVAKRRRTLSRLGGRAGDLPADLFNSGGGFDFDRINLHTRALRPGPLSRHPWR